MSGGVLSCHRYGSGEVGGLLRIEGLLRYKLVGENNDITAVHSE